MNRTWAHYGISWAELQLRGAFLTEVVPTPRRLVDYARLDEVAIAQRSGYGARVLPPAEVGNFSMALQRAGAQRQEGTREPEDDLRDMNTYVPKSRRRRAALGKDEDGADCSGGDPAASDVSIPWHRAPDWMPSYLEQPHERQEVGDGLRELPLVGCVQESPRQFREAMHLCG